MRTAEETRKIQGLQIPFTYFQYESLDEALEAAGSEEALLRAINSDQRTSAVEGQRHTVDLAARNAKGEGFDVETLQAAVDENDGGEVPLIERLVSTINEAQNWSESYTPGTILPSRRSTAKQERQVGRALTTRFTQEQIVEMVRAQQGDEAADALIAELEAEEQAS